MTLPTSAETISASKSSNRFLMTSPISVPLIPNFALPLLVWWLRVDQATPQLLQASGHAGVDHPVAELEDHAAHDRGVDVHLQHDLLAQPLGQLVGDPAGVRRRQLDRG